jgi:hypothetical protein
MLQLAIDHVTENGVNKCEMYFEYLGFLWNEMKREEKEEKRKKSACYFFRRKNSSKIVEELFLESNVGINERRKWHPSEDDCTTVIISKI